MNIYCMFSIRSLRSETVHISWKGGRELDVGRAGELHQDALHTDSEAAVRGHTVLKASR